MAWTRASRPVEAVTAWGRLRVSPGSKMAVLANMKSDTTPFLSRLSVSLKMEMDVTSDPVPAVVGIKMLGRQGPGTRPTPA